MKKKLIVFLTTVLMTFNISLAKNNFASDENFVVEYNTVKLDIPAIVRCKESKEYSVEINGRQNYLYKISIMGDTLVISPYFKNSEIEKMNHEDVIITLKHPQPKKIIDEIKINEKNLKKTKSGNLRK